jgi:Icc-related predicted phosphoesterase
MAGSAIFITDLHGHISRYETLFSTLMDSPVDYVFFGGDLLPHGLRNPDGIADFSKDYLFPRLKELKEKLKEKYPEMFVILGNDDFRSEETKFIEASAQGLFHYLNMELIDLGRLNVIGYPFVPPTPFRLKDWEKYDVDQEVRPGCLPPESGFRSTNPDYDPATATIASDLDRLTANLDLSNTVVLFHSPPYDTKLDRANLDDMRFGDIQPDNHIGSLAIKEFIEHRQPLLTLHGHVHESTRRTGHWQEKIKRTVACNGAHGGRELCILKFKDLQHPEHATRELK